MYLEVGFTWYCHIAFCVWIGLHLSIEKFSLRSHWGGYVFLFSISVWPTWHWTLGDCSAHWWKAPSYCWPLNGVPQPIQDTAGLWRPQAYHCQVHNVLSFTVIHTQPVWRARENTDCYVCQHFLINSVSVNVGGEQFNAELLSVSLFVWGLQMWYFCLFLYNVNCKLFVPLDEIR